MKRNILENTMVEMKWPEIEAHAKANATVLFPVGVIEEHGIHMCLGTDTYISVAFCEKIREVMEENGHKAIIAPPFYWGIVSGVNSTFPGTFTARKETVKALIFDIAQSLKSAGFKNIICINSHGDWNHCQTVIEACKEATEGLGIQVMWQTYEDDAEGQGLAGDEPYVLAVPPYLSLFKEDEPGKDSFDVHAGAYETEIMKELFPHLVDFEIAKTLPATNLQGDQIGQWAEGSLDQRYLAPHGHCGNPAGYIHLHSDTYSAAKHIAEGIIKRIRS